MNPTPPPEPSRQSNLPTVLLAGGFGVFLTLLGALVASSLARREAPMFEPTTVSTLAPNRPPQPRRDTVTLDARHEHQWRFYDFDHDAVLAPGDSTGWDLAVRRFNVKTRGTVTTTPGATPDDARAPAPADAPTHSSAEIGKWYDYSWLTHLLTPRPFSYGMRTDEGGTVTFTLVSYYCTDLVAGCLTVDYRYRPSSDVERP